MVTLQGLRILGCGQLGDELRLVLLWRVVVFFRGGGDVVEVKPAAARSTATRSATGTAVILRGAGGPDSAASSSGLASWDERVDLRVDAWDSRQRADCGSWHGDMRCLGSAAVLRGERDRLECERCRAWHVGRGRRLRAAGGPRGPTEPGFDKTRSPRCRRYPSGQRRDASRTRGTGRADVRRPRLRAGRDERTFGRARTPDHSAPTAPPPRRRGRIGRATLTRGRRARLDVPEAHVGPSRASLHLRVKRPPTTSRPAGRSARSRRHRRALPLRGDGGDSARRGAGERGTSGPISETRPHGTHPGRASASTQKLGLDATPFGARQRPLGDRAQQRSTAHRHVRRVCFTGSDDGVCRTPTWRRHSMSQSSRRCPTVRRAPASLRLRSRGRW